MRLIGLAITLAVSLFAAPLTAEAQSAGKISRIGYLFVSPPTSPSPLRIAFIQALRDIGWIEGSNLAIEIRSANGRPERLPALIGDLLRLKVDVIFASDPVSAAAARQARRSSDCVHDSWRSCRWRARRQPCPPGRQSDRLRRDGP